MRPTLFITRDDAGKLLLVLLICAALAMAFSAVVAARRILLELPVDYLSRPPPSYGSRSLLRAFTGAALVVAGLMLLVLPGPGVVLIMLGLLAWRARPLRALLERPLVLRAVNAFRSRHGRPALATLPAAC